MYRVITQDMGTKKPKQEIIVLVFTNLLSMTTSEIVSLLVAFAPALNMLLQRLLDKKN